MCFSATASFATAAGTGLIGVLAITKVSRWRELPLATMPLIFAAQQTVEGVLWILLGNGSHADLVGPLANIFVFCALVLWPVWSPLSLSLIEENRVRRLAMIALFALAIPVALVGARHIMSQPYGVCIFEHTLSYSDGIPYSEMEVAGYILCTCCPLLISSQRVLRMFGAIVVTGLAVSAFFYIETSFSVWCFFAAAGSVVVYLYFAGAPERLKANRAA